VKPWLDVDGVTVFHGDCRDVMRDLPDDSVDSVVTDPPYDLTANKRGGSGEASVTLANPYGRARIGGFMGKEWDATGVAFEIETWAEALRVLKPGGHLLAFGGTRTWHRLAVAIEDAGFEVRDSVAWMYGSGFPKSLDVSKAIDKADGRSGARSPNSGGYKGGTSFGAGPASWRTDNYIPSEQHEPKSEQAKTWQGWGTALKPAHEPIVVARKPLIGTVAENVQTHGTGALNIDGCRIEASDQAVLDAAVARMAGNEVKGDLNFAGKASIKPNSAQGRWPANVILDESQAAELDKQSGVTSYNPPATWKNGTGTSEGWGTVGKAEPGETRTGFGDRGGASRFFYVAKANKKERPNVNGIAHPTVKPMTLMRYLVRLVTPPGGTVLEPFAGSGTTIEACVIEGFNCIAIEREADYLPLIQARLNRPIQAAL
jgi:DNA modification methylase